MFELNPVLSKGIHHGFETMDRCHQVQKRGTSGPTKGLTSYKL